MLWPSSAKDKIHTGLRLCALGASDLRCFGWKTINAIYCYTIRQRSLSSSSSLVLSLSSFSSACSLSFSLSSLPSPFLVGFSFCFNFPCSFRSLPRSLVFASLSLSALLGFDGKTEKELLFSFLRSSKSRNRRESQREREREREREI